MNTIRVVLYLNQFFAGLGAEEYAGTGPGKKSGAVGPGIALQQALGEGAHVVATVHCGDIHSALPPMIAIGSVAEIDELPTRNQPELSKYDSTPPQSSRQ